MTTNEMVTENTNSAGTFMLVLTLSDGADTSALKHKTSNILFIYPGVLN